MSSVNARTTAPRRSPHPAFEQIRRQEIESLKLVVEEYRHKKTGARHYHLAADNPENVFIVAFRTVPTDSTGVAHILEHTVLCGSERYPVRDPFFMMVRRSLNTFMNAFTSSDWTAYPFASTNKKDFKNLLDVYLDAAFFARLHELDFAQEGHRVEFEKADDSSTDLVFKGVVFNEMKGAMSSPVSVLWQALTKHLFPTTTYHHNSGGDPANIPDLSYEALRAFYQDHYHPSNAVFMTYGDIPVYEHHEMMEARALGRFERSNATIAVADERRYTAPLSVEERYALDDSDPGDKTHVVLGWLLGHSTDLKEQLKAHLLSGVLLDNSASPLRHALETTQLGSAPSPLSGVEDSNREMAFMCGVEGSRPEHADAVEALVLDVLRQVAEQGVPRERVEAVLHQLELNQREVDGGGYPYGLHLILSSLSAAIHDGDPVASLNIDTVLQELRQEIADPAYIPRLIRELLLDNPHRVRLTMRPDPDLAARRAEAERTRLAAMKAAMSDADKDRVVTRSAELAQRQAQQDDEDILPKVGLEDIPTEVAATEGSNETVAGFPATFYGQGTNGLAYQQIIAPLPDLEDELLEVLPYYTGFLTELGCGPRDYRENQAWQDSVSGGISASTSVRGRIDDEQAVSAHFVLSGKALARNHAALSELMQQTLESVRFDELDRIRDLVAQRRARRERSVTGNGHALAMRAAASGMSPAAAMTHRLSGLAGIAALRQLDACLDSEDALNAFAEKLHRLHQRIVAVPRQFLLVGEADRHSSMRQDLSDNWRGRSLEASGFRSFSLNPIRKEAKQLWTTSTEVNFCAKAYPTVPVDHPDAAVLSVLGGFLRNGYLHRAIREQGGAYGGGAGQDSDISAFRFYSYRDPRLTETLDDFDEAVRWLLSGNHQWRQVEEAILGVIAALDKPRSPAGEALYVFHSGLYGRSPAQRQRFRQRVLDVTIDDLRRAGETYLVPEKASVAVITNTAGLQHHGDLGLTVHKL